MADVDFAAQQSLARRSNPALGITQSNIELVKITRIIASLRDRFKGLTRIRLQITDPSQTISTDVDDISANTFNQVLFVGSMYKIKEPTGAADQGQSPDCQSILTNVNRN